MMMCATSCNIVDSRLEVGMESAPGGDGNRSNVVVKFMGRGERRCRGPSAMVIYDVRRWRATIISALSASVVAPDADAIGCSQSQLTIEGERRGERGRSP